MTDDEGTTAEEVRRVVDALAGAGCAAWLVGGWGVDALVGRQTRRHRDLDLAFDAGDEVIVLEVLRRLGYTLETDWRPVRCELAAPPARFVDLHPVVLDDDGAGIQAGFDGSTFRYPSTSFTTGLVAGRPTRCVSVEMQLQLHSGYELREIDRADLARLRTIAARRE